MAFPVADITFSLSNSSLQDECPIDIFTQSLVSNNSTNLLGNTSASASSRPHDTPKSGEMGRGHGSSSTSTTPEKRYLSSTLGRVLASCMAELCEQKPGDPIEFIARWLYRYLDNEMYIQEKAKFLEQARLVAEALRRERAERLKRLMFHQKQLNEAKKALFKICPEGFESMFGQRSMSTRASVWGVNFGLDSDGMHEDLLESGMSAEKGGASLQKKSIADREGEGGGLLRASFSQDDQRLAPETRRQRQRSVYSLESKSSVRRIRPIIATWVYEYPPGRMICKHPLLGNLAARVPTTQSSNLEAWLRGELTCFSIYDHELYMCLHEAQLYVTPVRRRPL